MSQNIYDNEKFFNEYISLRKRDDNYNDLLEQPAMRNLLPEIKDKTILDLGCGYGANCYEFAKMGAKKVLGVDISENMLSVAKSKYLLPNIEYLKSDMAEIDRIECKFDFVYSSLAFHYVKDFDKLIKDIYGLLNDGGILLFSQDHPIETSSLNESNHFIRNINGEAIAYQMSNYFDNSIRKSTWFVDGVEMYHRTFSQIMNALCDAGFKVTKVVEPIPSKEAVEKRHGLSKVFIKPTFIIIKAKR